MLNLIPLTNSPTLFSLHCCPRNWPRESRWLMGTCVVRIPREAEFSLNSSVEMLTLFFSLTCLTNRVHSSQMDRPSFGHEIRLLSLWGCRLHPSKLWTREFNDCPVRGRQPSGHSFGECFSTQNSSTWLLRSKRGPEEPNSLGTSNPQTPTTHLLSVFYFQWKLNETEAVVVKGNKYLWVY